MADMTIEEAKQAKVDMENEITKMIKDFEKKTGTRLNYMSIERERPKKSSKNDPETVMEDYSYDSRDIVTVSFEMRFAD